MLKIEDLFDLSHSLAGDYLAGFTYPWEALAGIGELISALGAALPAAEFDHPAEDVWIAKDATVYPSAYIHGPCIIGHGTEVRQRPRGRRLRRRQLHGAEKRHFVRRRAGPAL